MSKNLWIPWEPAPNLLHEYDLITLFERWQDQEISIELAAAHDSMQQIQLTIQWQQAFRTTRAPFFFDILTQAEITKNVSAPHLHWAFFEIQHSKYLEQLSHESFGLYPVSCFTHLAIVTQQALIEIAALNFCKESVKVEMIHSM